MRRVSSMRLAILAVSAALAGGCAPTGPGSMGAVLGRDNETRALYVRDVPPGLGAEKAGLRPGDQLVMIEGFYVKDLTAEQIRKRLRGDAGSTVELTLLRGEEVRHVRVTRVPMREHRAAPPPKEERIAE
jgi:C-terminal processing protease CtpA/Prc